VGEVLERYSLFFGENSLFLNDPERRRVVPERLEKNTFILPVSRDASKPVRAVATIATGPAFVAA